MAKRKLEIEILPVAQIDLREIVDFISQGSKHYALVEKRLIVSAIQKLSDYPELGKVFEYRAIDARKYIFRNYIIIYRFKNETTIEILTVHHHARLFGNNPAFDIDE